MAATLHVIDDHAYCVYAAGAGPERGMCPPDVATLVVRRGVSVGTDDPGRMNPPAPGGILRVIRAGPANEYPPAPGGGKSFG